MISVGFSDGIPAYSDIKGGTANSQTLSATAPALVIYGYSYGTRKGDILRLSLQGPRGEVIAQDVVMDRPQAQAFRAIGKKRRARLWRTGKYEGTVTLLRDGAVIDTRRGSLTVR